MLSYSQETHTCRVSLRCEIGGGSSDSQGGNRPWSSLQTESNKRGYGSYYYRYQISENIIQSFYPWQKFLKNVFNRRVISTKPKILFLIV